MKNNRELMELAAKAAGLLPLPDGKDLDYTEEGDLAFCGGGEFVRWNPLTDDGDALRLAVKLDLDIRQFSGAIGYPPHVLVSYRTSNGSIDLIDEHGDDAMSATRRAIVLIAAEIGGRIL